MNGFADGQDHAAGEAPRFPAPGSGASAVEAAYSAIAATPSAGSSPYMQPTSVARARQGRLAKRALQAAVLLLLVVGALIAFTASNGSLTIGESSGSMPGGNLGGYDSWSFYRQTNVDSDQYAPRWDKGFNEFSTASTWEYEGPYRYGGYGKAGMQSRDRAAASGKAARDPLYSNTVSDAAMDDVFAEYDSTSTDPTSGRPVGADPADLNPWYDPWASSWSNPYANRMRLAWGESSERDAWMR